MSLTKDGFYKSFSGAIGNNNYLLEAGGGHIGWGNAARQIPYSNGTVNTSLNADMTDGLHVHTGRNNEANKIVRTDGSGYIQAGWINTTSGNMGTTAIDRIYCSNDGYIRYKTVANFKTALFGGAVGSPSVPIYWTGSAFATCIVSFGNSSYGEHNANNINDNGIKYYNSNGPSTSLGATTGDGALYSQAYNTSWVGQIAQDYRNGGLYVRGKNNGTWQSWYRVWDNRTTYVSGGKGYIGRTEITQVNNADTVDGHHQDHLLPYRYTYGAQTNSGSVWYVRIQTANYISEDCTIYVRGTGNNCSSDLVIHVLTRGGRFWGWQTSFNGCRITGISKETGTPEIIYLRMPDTTTSISFKSTHSLTIDKANYSSKSYMDISSEGLFANYILGRIQNADYTDNLSNPGKYYWANLSVQTASSNTTVPSFGAIRMNGATSAGTNYITGAAGRIYFGGNFHIDSLGSNATYINHYTANNVYMVSGSSQGRVGIGTTSPSYKLHVIGDSYVTGWSRAASGFYCHDTGVHYTHKSTSGEINITSSSKFLISGNSSTMNINSEAVSRGTLTSLYVWNAGSSSKYADHKIGKLHVIPTSGSYSYNEGIRIHTASNGWTSLAFCGTDNTGDSGTSANTWSMHTNGGNFYLNKNNSSTATVNRIWGRSGGGFTFGNTANASYVIESAGDVRTATGWFRSNGQYGWYSESYGGGIYMTDSTYVRVYNSKAFYVANSTYYAMNTAGGFYGKMFSLNTERYILKPWGANFTTTTSSYTGAITITLPAGIGNTMVSMWIDVYLYSTNTSFSVHVGGYTYNNSTWSNNPFAMVYGANHTVRLGHNGTSFIIYIGETNSTWSYPQITVRDVILGFSPTFSKWVNQWTIGFSTSFSNVTATITHYAYTTKNLNPNECYVTQNISSNADYPLIWTNQNNTSNVRSNQLYKSYDYLLYNPSTKVLRNDGPLWLRPDRDATLKIYSGKITDGYSDGFICMQTSIDGTDGQSHSHPTNYGARCVIALQPRGGEVYVGKTITAASTSADTTYKLNVGGHGNFDGNIWTRGSGVYLRIGPQNSSHAYYETNAGTSHWFNKRIDVNGDIYLYGTSTRIQKSNEYVYAKGFYHLNYGSAYWVNRTDGGAACFNYGSKNASSPSYVWGWAADNDYRLYSSSYLYKSATHTISNPNTSNTWLRIATITISGTDLSIAGFTAIFSNRECLDNTSFILTLSIRRNNTTSAAGVEFYYNAIQGSVPRTISLRSNDNKTFYVYFQSAASSWTTYYNVTKIMTEGNVTYENVGTTSPIAGSITNVNASKGGNVQYADTLTNPGKYYWANVQISATSSTSTSPTFSTAYTSNWFRSTGSTGWYSESYGGGIYMVDSTWVRTYNGKAFYTSSGQIRSDGSVAGGKILLTSDLIGFYSGVGGSGTRYGYIQTNATYMYFRKENGNSGFNFNGNLVPSSNLGANIGTNALSWNRTVTRYLDTRHLDATAEYTSDMNLYIGYGAITPTQKTLFYYSTGTRNSAATSRTQFAEVNSNGLYALVRFGVNGQNTSYNLYVNGTSYHSGNTWQNGVLYLSSHQGSWVSGMTTNPSIWYNNGNKIDASSYWAFYAMKSSSNHVINFGGLGDRIGFYGYYAGRTSNSTDWNFTVNMTNGIWASSKRIDAYGFYHSSYGSATYLLRSDGGVAAFNWSGQSGQPTWVWGGNSQHTYYVYNPSNFSVNYANYSGYTNELRYTSGTNVNVNFADGAHTRVYYNNADVSKMTNPPTSYGLLVNFGGNAGHLQLYSSSTSNEIYIRSYWWTGGSGFSYPSWEKLLHTGNAYWANIKVQTASSNTTVPSFGAIRMNGASSAGTNYITGSAGRIYFGGNFHIDSLGSNSTYINHYTANNVYMVTGGGKVGIGNSTPSYKLHVSGDTYITGYAGIGNAPSSSNGRLVFPENNIAIGFRPNNDSYKTSIQYMSVGNEALVFSTQQAVTSFIFKCGHTASNGSDWQSGVIGTPSVQIKQQSLYVNGYIANGANAGYNFYVGGTSYHSGNTWQNGVLYLSSHQGMWVSGMTTNPSIWYNNGNKIDASSYWAFYAMKSSSNHVINFGGLGDNLGFYGYKAGRTDNSYDWNFTVNASNGCWNMYTSETNDSSTPIAKFVKNWDCGNRARYDTVVISSDDCTSLRLIEQDGTCTGISAGDGKSVIATTHYLQFCTGGSGDIPIYNGMGTTEVVRISTKKLTMFAGQQNNDYSANTYNNGRIIDLSTFTSWVPSSIHYTHSSGRCVLFFPIPSNELLGSIIYIHRIYYGDWLGTVRNPSYPSMNNAETIWDDAERYCHSTEYIMNAHGATLRWIAEGGNYRDNAVFYRCEYDSRLNRYVWREHWTGGTE